ncbi:hypothetical protein [Microcystis sp. M037S2]|uniref:hypothetical protein n=1 Tax=Microcystis sp. M037S2 TaxID=2771163 RepID=UPI002586D234|nr:hypothetical protein [Microcystis sp. M037S2]MCA2688364.1 hypothetical protein [Microcystis sp. M037S2]MCA2732430.1 hypothetical protein [Microcystis sp. M158S2]MCA2737517.1 hypothetical protein [Microcystis sp. M165S2]MCA2765144.1 hypothetical protein [Microcystis sp. M151S2]
MVKPYTPTPNPQPPTPNTQPPTPTEKLFQQTLSKLLVKTVYERRSWERVEEV